MKKNLLVWIFTILMFLMLVPMPNVKAEEEDEIVTLQLSLEYGQSEARTIFNMINRMRTSSTDAWYWNEDNTTKTKCNNLSKLQYDYDLEKVAMTRAKEIALSYDHTRPNGERCFTAYDGIERGAAGENIAAGYKSASAVNEAWREDDKSYSGQGHRRNMLSGNFNCVGIGHVYYNGYHYWVEEFAYRNSVNTNATTANNSKQIEPVEVLLSNIGNLWISLDSDSYNVSLGNSVSVKMDSGSSVVLEIKNNWPNGEAPIADIPQFGVSDSSIASYSDGKLVGIKAGKTNLTVGVSDLIFELSAVLNVHDLEKIEAVNATYTKAGNKKYYKCKTCNKLFSDAKCENETTIKEITIPMLQKKSQTITGVKSSYIKTYGNAKFSLNAKAKGKLTYQSNKPSVVTVSKTGVVTIKGAGTAKIKIMAAQTSTYNSITKTVTITVKKASPSITVKSSDAKKTISYSKVKKKAQSFQLKASVNSKAKLTYKKSSGSSKLTVSKTGKITVAKGSKKGTYSMNVKVSAAAKGNYNSDSKTVKVTVVVK